MTHNRLRSIACRAATSRPVDSLVAIALHQGFKRLGYRLLPHEWIEGIDRFFVRDMMGNIDTDGDGSSRAGRRHEHSRPTCSSEGSESWRSRTTIWTCLWTPSRS